MQAPSEECLRQILRKNFSEQLTDEILAMTERLWEETKDAKKVEMRVRQHLMDHILNDLGSTMKNIAQWPHIPRRGPQNNK